jgi:galactose mutarotase-like enzyme
MPLAILENEYLTIAINSKGAELTSIVHKQNGLEYMWSGDPAVWGKHSPVLFPIVGTLKQQHYIFQGKQYELSRHGFAREKEFNVSQQSQYVASFLLNSNSDTLSVYPFQFTFYLHYTLEKNRLRVTYEVNNIDSNELFFSVGAHPAFAVPLAKNTSYNDYCLYFEQPENLARWPITADGLIDTSPVPIPNVSQRIPITKELFSKDALVFKQLKSTAISILSDKTQHGLTVSFPGFPFMGIWAAKGGDFVCIEPWCGIADSIHATQQLTEKEGIQRLPPNTNWERTWSIDIF